MTNNLFVYIVTFNNPFVQGDRPRAFTSLAAIYEEYSSYEIGIVIGTLWNKKIDIDNPYHGKRCSIYKFKVLRKKQNNLK